MYFENTNKGCLHLGHYEVMQISDYVFNKLQQMKEINTYIHINMWI